MESFLFSLVNPLGDKPTKLPLNGTSNHKGIHCDGSEGPIFGEGHDLKIGNNANVNTDSYTQLAGTYECPPHASSTTFLVGDENFTVDELEVFVFQE